MKTFNEYRTFKSHIILENLSKETFERIKNGTGLYDLYKNDSEYLDQQSGQGSSRVWLPMKNPLEHIGGKPVKYIHPFSGEERPASELGRFGVKIVKPSYLDSGIPKNIHRHLPPELQYQHIGNFQTHNERVIGEKHGVIKTEEHPDRFLIRINGNGFVPGHVAAGHNFLIMPQMDTIRDHKHFNQLSDCNGFGESTRIGHGDLMSSLMYGSHEGRGRSMGPTLSTPDRHTDIRQHPLYEHIHHLIHSNHIEPGDLENLRQGNLGFLRLRFPRKQSNGDDYHYRKIHPLDYGFGYASHHGEGSDHITELYNPKSNLFNTVGIYQKA